MTSAFFSVRISGQGSSWGYRLVSSGGRTLVSRHGYASQALARAAAYAASDALAPICKPVRLPHTSKASLMSSRPQLRVQKLSLWKTLFG